jgi:hypothetical protein
VGFGGGNHFYAATVNPDKPDYIFSFKIGETDEFNYYENNLFRGRYAFYIRYIKNPPKK